MTLTDYIKAPRPFYSIFFIEVILGALFALNFQFLNLDLRKMFIIFISFQSLYFGLYMINDVIDYNSDRLVKEKLNRPIISGKISRINAVIYSLCLILIAFLIAIFISYALLGFELFFLIYNIIYSLFLKKIPYLDTLAGGVTHAARFIMGIALFGSFAQYFLALAVLLTATSFNLIKRLNEMGYKKAVKRPSSCYSYKRIKLIWILFGFIIFLLIILSGGLERTVIEILLLSYAALLIGYAKSSKIKEYLYKFSN